MGDKEENVYLMQFLNIHPSSSSCERSVPIPNYIADKDFCIDELSRLLTKHCQHIPKLLRQEQTPFFEILNKYWFPPATGFSLRLKPRIKAFATA
jgi:hypothetical protein